MNKPTGIVTFLFTDIEGSTKLSQDYPDTLQTALDIHHAIMHKAIESNSGFVFEIVGDAFCCAFENAEDAVKAAVDAQLGLSNEKWEDAVIKIRIGIHSGPAEWNGKRYMGYITLARSARIMSCGYGEQIIISGSTYDLCKEKFDAVKEKNISFRDLGERRMKDVIQPVRIYQILSTGLREDFPPLKTLDARPNNLPVQLSSFIGREDAMKEVKNLLVQSRLLTILGPGGGGKTRLAMQAGADMIDDFANGVFITELALVSDPSLVVQFLMNVLEVKEEPGRAPGETLQDHLKDKELLLILDNCEHLINECANLSEILLSKCTKLKIIATSREALNCSGERTFLIPPLSLPDITVKITTEQLTQYEAVRLFIERAISVNPGFRINNENAPSIAEICSRLDGIPLAIELAAVRINVLPVEKICAKLDDRFRLLTGGKRTALPRQQTLRALIDWSYDLLSENEKLLWSRLSVFNGGWTLESAEKVCTDKKIESYEILDLLCSLTDKSIINYKADKDRYNMLETLKQYGEEKLKEAGGAGEIISKHLDYYMELSEEAEPKLKSSESKIWLEILESDHDNFQTAIIRSIYDNEWEKGSRLAGALGRFWKIRGHQSTGRKLLDSVLGNEKELSKPFLRKLLSWSGILSHDQGEYETSLNYHNRSLIISKELNDKTGIAGTLNSLGAIESDMGNNEKAQEYYFESLALRKETGDKFDIARSLNNLGSAAYEIGDFEKAQKFYNESLEIKRSIGDQYSVAETLSNLGNIAYAQGKYEQAQNFQEECLALNREVGNKNGMADSLNNLGKTKYTLGKYEQARKYYEESLTIQNEIGDKSGISHSLNDLGNLFIQLEKFEQAWKYFEESLALFSSMGEKLGIAISLNNLGRLSLIKGEYKDARKFIEESLGISREIGDKWGIALTLNGLGNLAYYEGNYESARRYYLESLALKQKMEDTRGIVFTLIGYSGILCIEDRSSEAVILLGTADNVMKSSGSVPEFIEQKLMKEIISSLHDRLDDEEFMKQFEEGRKMTLEGAVQLKVKS